MTDTEAQALADAGKRWGYWNQRQWLSTDELLAVANREKDGAAYFELSLRYELGIELPASREEALFYLKKAAEKIGAAQVRLVTEYRDGGHLVEKDPAEWMTRLQEAAATGINAACDQLAELKRAGRRARDCSAAELNEIEALFARAESFYRAGSMYCTDKNSPQCSNEEVTKAREWYRKGINRTSRHDCPDCVGVLRSWGELSSTEAPSKSISTTELVIAPFALLIWSIIGTALLGIVLSINSVTIPLVIALSVVAAIYRAFKR